MVWGFQMARLLISIQRCVCVSSVLMTQSEFMAWCRSHAGEYPFLPCGGVSVSILRSPCWVLPSWRMWWGKKTREVDLKRKFVHERAHGLLCGTWALGLVNGLICFSSNRNCYYSPLRFVSYLSPGNLSLISQQSRAGWILKLLDNFSECHAWKYNFLSFINVAFAPVGDEMGKHTIACRLSWREISAVAVSQMNETSNEL